MQLPRLVGEMRGMRGMLTLLGPLAPCSDTELLPGLPVHRWVSGGGIFSRQAQVPRGTAAPVLLLPGGTNPAGTPSLQPRKAGLAPQRPCSQPRPSTGAVPLGCAKPCAEVPSPRVSALLRGCAAAAGGSCKEPLPVSTDPEAKGQACHASWVSLGSARLAREGWEFLKASGVALKRFNL